MNRSFPVLPQSRDGSGAFDETMQEDEQMPPLHYDVNAFVKGDKRVGGEQFYDNGSSSSNSSSGSNQQQKKSISGTKRDRSATQEEENNEGGDDDQEPGAETPQLKKRRIESFLKRAEDQELQGIQALEAWVARVRAPYIANSLTDQRFKRLDPGLIRDRFVQYEKNLDLRIADDFLNKCTLGGGIYFEMKGVSVRDQEAEQADQLTWLPFLKRKEMYKMAIGFTPCLVVPEAKYGAMPTVLNLESEVDVWYHRTAFNDDCFIFRERQDNGRTFFYAQQGKYQRAKLNNGLVGSDYTFEGGIIPRVVIFVDRSPSPDGTINSLVGDLEGDQQHESKMLSALEIATEIRALPPIWTEAKIPKQTAQGVSGSIMSDGDANKPVTEDAIRKANYWAAKQNELGPAVTRRLLAEVQRLEECMDRRLVQQRMDLETGRAYVQSQMPEAPTHLIDHRLQKFQRVLAARGIPASLLQSESVRGRMAHDQTAEDFLARTLLHIKTDHLVVCRAMIQDMFDIMRVKGGTIDKNAERKIEISLPGVPTAGATWELYERGILKYDAYKNYVNRAIGIPKSDLEAFAKVSPKELLGVPPPKPPTAGGGASKAKGKPSKGKSKSKARSKSAGKSKTKSKSSSSKPKSKTTSSQKK